MQTLVFVVIQLFMVYFCLSIFVDGCERGQGRGAGGTAGGASLAPINKNREHDGPCLCPYIDHKWPESLQPSMFGHIDYIGHGITIASDVWAISTRNGDGITAASDVCTTYYRLNDLRQTWNHYCHRCLDDLLPPERLGSSHSKTKNDIKSIRCKKCFCGLR